MKLFSTFLSLLFASALFGQNTGLWSDHLPYNTVTDIAVDGDLFFCATDQGLFVFDRSENEISTYSKLNGLNDIGVGSIAFNKENRVLVVGYKNANIDLISGDNIVNMSDIVRANGYTGKKRINHVLTIGDRAWLATGFGIVELDLENVVVNGTYIIGPNGSELEVYHLAVDETDNRMYAATPDGLYSADMSNPLIFFQFWEKDTTLTEDEVTLVAALNGHVFANVPTAGSIEDSVFYNNGSGWTYLQNQGPNKKYDLRAVNDHLVLVNPFNAIFYRNDLSIKYLVGSGFSSDVLPLCGYILEDGQSLLIGNDGSGLLFTNDLNYNKTFFANPNGPPSSKVFRMYADDKRMYVAPGAIDELWTQVFLNQGIYKLDDFDWQWIEPDSINNINDVVTIIGDPNDPNVIYAAAWGTGILELRNDVLVNVWDNSTTGGALVGPPSSPTQPRSGGVAFDEAGNLWVTSSQSQRPIAVRRTDGSWENFSGGPFSGFNVFDIYVNELNQKWIRTRTNGILVMDDSGLQPEYRNVTAGAGSGNLPSKTVLDFAEDLDGEIWIGTSEGLAVLYSPQNIFKSGQDFDSQPILFEEEGVVQRLLGIESVSAVAVDGANKKWFGTLNSGVFYTSDDGTETIHHFTAENSPLLSNVILDIAIDHTTGEVYFATDEGVVSYKGSATRGYEDYTDVYAYPNPVRPGHVGPVYIRGLVTNARIKITDVAGNLVYETIAEGGQASWDTKNLDGQDVVSGVYLAYIADDLGEKTTVTKILVVR